MIPFEERVRRDHPRRDRLRRRLDDAAPLMESARIVLLPIAVLYAMTLFFAAAKYHPATVQAIIERQGLANVLLGALAGSVRALAPLALVAGLIVIVAGKLSPPAAVPLALLLAVISMALIPWTFLLLAVVIAAVSVAVLSSRRPVAVALIVPAALLALILLISVSQAWRTPWLPIERISAVPATSGAPAEASMHVGYVLGEEGGLLALLRDSDREVIWLIASSITSRELCGKDGRWWNFDAPSIFRIGDGGYRPCDSAEQSAATGPIDDGRQSKASTVVPTSKNAASRTTPSASMSTSPATVSDDGNPTLPTASSTDSNMPGSTTSMSTVPTISRPSPPTPQSTVVTTPASASAPSTGSTRHATPCTD